MGGLVLKLVLIYSALFMLCCSSMQLNLQGNETDRLALLAIKARIVQHDPSNLKGIMSSWSDSIHFCLWGGVTCSRRHHQRVTVLNLHSQSLTGSLSPHIGNLSFLRYLFLYNNNFSHEIPPQIGHLRRLQVFSIMNNSFTGHIPSNISNCLNLILLNLGGNNLVGEIPSQLGFLSKLDFLDFEDNNLTGVIPSSFGNLSSLTVIAGGMNNLVGSIPSSLGQLKKLTFISFPLNLLSGTFPSSMYNLSSIARFDLSYNKIQGSLPSDLSSVFPILEYFAIMNNDFTGTIPSSISNATNLVAFIVGGNSLTGQVPSLRKLHKLWTFNIVRNQLGSSKQGDLSFVSELINATRLFRLTLGENNFGGTLPTSVSNLSTDLTFLWLGGNKLHGSIPNGIGNLVNLQYLGIEDNSFTGNIPTDIGKLSALGVLLLYNNKLSGSIPSSLANLTTLTNLDLHRNNLNSSIPASLGKCQGLLLLDLSENNLVGPIPTALVNGLVSTTSINLSTNHLVGSLPVEFRQLRTLGKLDMSYNLLSGELPSSLSTCESLEVLHLQGNFFQGSIPSSFKEFKSMRDLDLSRNNMSGEIPQFLEDFGNLKNLNLSYNVFKGAVPVEGVFKNASAISVVGNAGLCSSIASLKLPVCKLKVSKRRGLSSKMKIMISLVAALTLLGLAMLLYFLLFRKKKKAVEVSTLGNSLLQVSYATLLKATNGFSTTNLIGAGAFGSVFKGILEDDGVVVAVKVFNMLHKGASKSFIAECEALRNIKHRNLVKILTACSSIDFNGNDFKALVYEFMENGSLEEWLLPSAGTDEEVEAPKNLSLVQRVDIAIDVASALDYLHNHCETPIVHCDLKPSNVLLDTNLTGHVSDFGISRFLSEPISKIVSGNQSSSIGIRGSVGYAAPEYGMGSEVSTDGDVYSFGILLLEMFTGKRPTDHMFSDGMNLHNYVKRAIPDRVSEIFYSRILQLDTGNGSEAHNKSTVSAQKIKECLTLIFGIGTVCSVESPTSRKNISEVVTQLHSIKNNLLC